MKKDQMPHKIFLPNDEVPKQWYNIAADMKELPAPYLHPVTKEVMKPEDMEGIFPKAIVEQEVSLEKFIDIPEGVQEKYRLFRSTPLQRAFRLEEALGTPARIYYKYEGANPSGSHKLNSAIPQAYYNKMEGVKKLTTETGAGQWGTALSMACQVYGLECTVYMVDVSYEQKPHRRTIMQLYGANVIASPSTTTNVGRKIREENPGSHGSLGDAIAEAVEVAMGNSDTKYSLGSVLNHVVLHQTIIGQEAKKQLEMVDEYPDIVIGCNGGGSNFSGLAFPFLKDKLEGHAVNTRYIAVEAAACPKLTKGIYAYDYGDTVGVTPICKMYTLGHSYHPPGIHAGGLRYHGDSSLLSKLYHDGYLEAEAMEQKEAFEAAMLFSHVEALVPAPESSHAIAQAVREAVKCRESGEEKVILFNLSGNGYFDMTAYENYLNGKLVDDAASVEENVRRAQENVGSVVEK